MNPAARPAILIWWVIWAGIVSALLAIYFVLGRAASLPAAAATIDPDSVILLGLGPFLISFALRWVVMPRLRTAQQALVVFVIGLALAESCGFIGVFLGGDLREPLFALGFIGVLQWVPVFVRQFVPATRMPLHH